MVSCERSCEVLIASTTARPSALAHHPSLFSSQPGGGAVCCPTGLLTNCYNSLDLLIGKVRSHQKQNHKKHGVCACLSHSCSWFLFWSYQLFGNMQGPPKPSLVFARHCVMAYALSFLPSCSMAWAQLKCAGLGTDIFVYSTIMHTFHCLLVVQGLFFM
ncbi:hypothetical protein BKA57DRAFT_460267 [Linnemannia elongata]|nr:hypothetical protein BKA57DRAFT_460267 [Linnemannia elongata]